MSNRRVSKTALAVGGVTLLVTVVAGAGLAGAASHSSSPAPAAQPAAETTDNKPTPPPPPERPMSELKIDSMTPSPGTYGTGIAIRVKFNNDVPEEARESVTNHISVDTSKPLDTAGWAWTDDRTAVYRPEEFWPAHTKVEVHSYRTYDVVASDDVRDFVWTGDIDREFTVGRSQEIHVNGKTHQAQVVRDGQNIRTMPVSLGKEGWETRSGVKTLMESYRVKTMTGASIGAETDYELEVPYAIRMTDSGEFMHGAPWATANIGRVNGSHGCTNLGMADAAWLFDNHLVGDPVVTTGTGRSMEPGNGSGGIWNVSWDNWSKGIAS